MRMMTNSSNSLNLADQNLPKNNTSLSFIFPSILWLCKKSDHAVLGHQNCYKSENLHRFGYHYVEVVRSHFRVCTLWNTSQWYRFWQSKKMHQFKHYIWQSQRGVKKKKGKKMFLAKQKPIIQTRFVPFTQDKTCSHISHLFISVL